MARLEFTGKAKAYDNFRNLPIITIEFDASKSTEESSDLIHNKIIHGDNLLALRALQRDFQGKVKCVYIDPPYNTGHTNWIFDDNMTNHSLYESADEAPKADKHDQWLAMMLPRLLAIHDLLSDDGVILISIDDIEYARLKLLLDEVFGEQNFINTLVWYSPGDRDLNTIGENSNEHEYVVMYAKNIQNVHLFPGSPRSGDDVLHFGWPFNTKQPTLLMTKVSTADGMKESEAILGTGAFNYPKPSDLITLILKEFVDKDSIILDAFAGTGTTGHAVLKLNNQDNGRRQFILVEVEDYADKITAERIRRVSAGYIETGSGLHVKGLGGKFDYFEVHKDL